MIVKWTETAKADLQAIWDYIARDSVFYANKYVDELTSATDILEDFPERGRAIPEIGDPNSREIIYGSYRIMYHISNENIFITQVVHSARNFKPNPRLKGTTI